MTVPHPLLLRRALAAGIAVSAALAWGAAGGAHAAPIPVPVPVPVPEPGQGAVTPAPAEGGGGEIRVSAPDVAGESSSTSSALDPINLVPNINGYPCTGAWESTACYAMNFDSPPAVTPRSTISASP